MNIQITDTFDLQKIIDSGQCFRPYQTAEGLYRFIYRDYILDIRKISNDTFDISCDRKEWDSIWKDYFDLDTNYDEILKSIPSDDEYMLTAGTTAAGIRILKQDKWEMLISFIISQRKSIPAIRSSVEKLCRLYGHEIHHRNEIIYSFPTFTEMKNATEEELNGCGLGYRTGYILNAIEKANSGALDLESLSALSDEELDGRLLALKGVGNKVSNCVLLFAYHRVSRVPIDTWISKVINDEYRGVNPFVRYDKYAGIMQQYVFYSARLFANTISEK